MTIALSSLSAMSVRHRTIGLDRTAHRILSFILSPLKEFEYWLDTMKLRTLVIARAATFRTSWRRLV
jgi:hypothetical protein